MRDGAKLFEAACAFHQDKIDKLPPDHPVREAYLDGLSDGIRYTRRDS